MAKTMSLVMMIFMIVPALAPIVGQGVLFVGGWRYIFLVLAVYALVVLAWFSWRQPETLPTERRVPLSVAQIMLSSKTVVTHPGVMSFAVAQGVIVGAFIAFLSTSQQILQEQYALGTQFPLYFAMLAITLAIAAYFNATWVMRFGMQRMVTGALIVVLIASMLAGAGNLMAAQGLPLTGFMAYMLVVYACCGLLFGNLSSMAMSPMGKVAGVASSLIGFSSTLVAFTVGALIGRLYQADVFPIVAGFGLCAVLSGLMVFRGVRQVFRGDRESSA